MKKVFIIISFALFSFILIGAGKNYQQNDLRWSALPVENSKGVFNQCSREAPEFSRIITLDDSVFQKAIKLLTTKQLVLRKKADLNIEEYTLQLVGYEYKGKSYVYINASYTDLGLDDEMDWTEKPIIWCDGDESSWGLVYDIKKKWLVSFVTNGPMVTRIKKL